MIPQIKISVLLGIVGWGKILSNHELARSIGTAFYQLNHATLRVGPKRFHVVTWFGVCGYAKMKGKKVKAVATCPACHSEMIRKHHWGKRVIAKDIGDPAYQKWFVDDEFDESGLPNYVDAVGGRSE